MKIKLALKLTFTRNPKIEPLEGEQQRESDTYTHSELQGTSVAPVERPFGVGFQPWFVGEESDRVG